MEDPRHCGEAGSSLHAPDWGRREEASGWERDGWIREASLPRALAGGDGRVRHRPCSADAVPLGEVGRAAEGARERVEGGRESERVEGRRGRGAGGAAIEA